MALRHSTGWIPFGCLTLSLVVWCSVAEPAQAGHYPTHPASPTAAGPQTAELAGQAALGATGRTSGRAAAGAAAQDTSKPTAQVAPRAGALFRSGSEFAVQRDARLFITSRNLPEIIRLIERYNADRPNGGRFETKVGVAIGVPGLLDIARQVLNAQAGGVPSDQAYMLTDAMRDAIWRRETAARLWARATLVDSCAAGSGATNMNAVSNSLASGRAAGC